MGMIGERVRGFVEGDISRHKQVIGFNVIHPPTPLSIRIAKENTFAGTRGEFVGVTWDLGGIAKTPYGANVGVGGAAVVEDFGRCFVG